MTDGTDNHLLLWDLRGEGSGVLGVGRVVIELLLRVVGELLQSFWRCVEELRLRSQSQLC